MRRSEAVSLAMKWNETDSAYEAVEVRRVMGRE
jgi:hypothetical protein